MLPFAVKAVATLEGFQFTMDAAGLSQDEVDHRSSLLYSSTRELTRQFERENNASS